MCAKMPSVGDDWIANPLGVVDRLFYFSRETDPEKYLSSDWGVGDYFREKLAKEGGWAWVPSLNDVPLHLLKTGCLVRFRCMVQDMFDPEYYLGTYEAIDLKTHLKAVKTSKFRDIADCFGEEVTADSPGSAILQRQTLYCVPVPGESDWVKEVHRRNSRFQPEEDMKGQRDPWNVLVQTRKQKMKNFLQKM
eukprot:m.221372 g.221372  ORF g.221372 m.221372 type:complete len:192 (+) comp39959_c0_seq36:64-639(+)